MCPLFTKVVRDTTTKPDVTTKLQLDPAKIQPFVDEGKLDEAGEELVKQLMGSKFSTGKMQNYCLTDASFRMCARVKKHVEEANARKKLEGKERRKDKQTATAESKLAAKNKNLQDITAF